MEDFELALHKEVKAYGGTRLAKEMGVNETRLLDCLNPNRDTHKLQFEQFFQVVTHLPEDFRRRVLRALLDPFHYDLVVKPDAVGRAPLQALVDLVAESADVTRAVHDAIGDGRISSSEHFTIRREIAEVRHALDVLEQSVRVA